MLRNRATKLFGVLESQRIPSTMLFRGLRKRSKSLVHQAFRPLAGHGTIGANPIAAFSFRSTSHVFLSVASQESPDYSGDFFWVGGHPPTPQRGGSSAQGILIAPIRYTNLVSTFFLKKLKTILTDRRYKV